MASKKPAEKATIVKPTLTTREAMSLASQTWEVDEALAAVGDLPGMDALVAFDTGLSALSSDLRDDTRNSIPRSKSEETATAIIALVREALADDEDLVEKVADTLDEFVSTVAEEVPGVLDKILTEHKAERQGLGDNIVIKIKLGDVFSELEDGLQSASRQLRAVALDRIAQHIAETKKSNKT